MSKYAPLRFGKGLISFLIDKKAVVVFVILAIIVLLMSIVSIGAGEMNIRPLDVVRALFGEGSEMNVLVVNTLRLPRILIALLVGAALAVSGAIFQGIIRNPLASPEYMGVTGGASVAAVGFLVLFTNPVDNALTIGIGWLPVAAFLGATIVSLLVYILSWKNGVTPTRLVLIGIGLTMGMNAITTMLMLSGPLIIATESKTWLAGSVYAASWNHVWILFPWVFGLLVVTLILARNLNIQELGDELATGAGSAVQRERILLLLISAALAGGAVAFAGAISFVGLMAPHIARRLVGSAFGALLPVSAVMGALIVLVADLIARMAFSPLDVPAGVFTASIGAPYFIYLLYKTRNA